MINYLTRRYKIYLRKICALSWIILLTAAFFWCIFHSLLQHDIDEAIGENIKNKRDVSRKRTSKENNTSDEVLSPETALKILQEQSKLHLDTPSDNQLRVAKYLHLCKTYNQDQVIINSTALYVDSNLKYLLALPPKVGSSSWLLMIGEYYNFTFKGFAKNAKKFYQKTGIKYFHSFSEEDRQTILNEYKKVIIVRHPWRRIVSAYMDKVPKDVYHLHKIKSNKDGLIQYTGKKVTTFPDFVQYLIDIEIHKYDYRKVKDDGFIHFAPIHIQVNSCEIEYDYICKTENMEVDYSFLNELLFDGKAELKHIHSTKNNGSRERIMLSHMEQLSFKQFTTLYEMYKPDFELFGYNADISTKL